MGENLFFFFFCGSHMAALTFPSIDQPQTQVVCLHHNLWGPCIPRSEPPVCPSPDKAQRGASGVSSPTSPKPAYLPGCPGCPVAGARMSENPISGT